MKRANSRRSKAHQKEEYKQDDQSRIIMLSGDVDQEVIGDIIYQILQFNEEDDAAVAKNKNFVRQPIKLIINSYGGTIYDGLGLIDAIDGSITPIHTICYGSAMSMAMVILACGHVRYAGKHATIMYHEGGYAMDHAKIQAHKEDMKEVERIEQVCDALLLERTKLNSRTLKSIKSKKVDWYLTADEALKYKIIDGII